MPGEWTPERRAKAAETARRVKPWLHATGPKTEAGKAASAMRGYKGGLRPAQRARRRITKGWLRALRDINLETPVIAIRPTDEELEAIVNGTTSAAVGAPALRPAGTVLRNGWIIPPLPANETAPDGVPVESVAWRMPEANPKGKPGKR